MRIAMFVVRLLLLAIAVATCRAAPQNFSKTNINVWPCNDSAGQKWYKLLKINSLEARQWLHCFSVSELCDPIFHAYHDCREFMKDSTIRLTAENNQCIDIENYGTSDGSIIW